MVKLQQNYLEKEVFQGSSLDHVLMLYGKAINSLKLVKKNVEEGLNTPEAVKNKAEALTKAIDILVYLQAILDHEKGGDIATKLQEIYGILIDELVKFNFTNDLKVIQDSIEILENLRKAWQSIKAQKLVENKAHHAELVSSRI